ncbi:hypothetical protein ACTFIT_011118 [Dictyostelium discoideum]
MTSIFGDLILQDNGRIINRSGKVFGSDNFSYHQISLTVHVISSINNTTPIATIPGLSAIFAYNRSKGQVTIYFSTLTLPANTGGYADKMLGFTWTSTTIPTRVTSAYCSFICVDSTAGMTSTEQLTVAVQPAQYYTDTTV